MGKQKIQAILNQFKETHERDVITSAGIFSVAQIAVNQLDEVIETTQPQKLAALPPSSLTKKDLLARYQSYAGCRKAAKAYGIKFNKTPSWEKLIDAFNYVDALENLKNEYLKIYPNKALSGIRFELKL